jgi:DNA-binding MarR family transcriptional regulator
MCGMWDFGPMLGRCAHLVRERLEARLADWDGTQAQIRVLLYLSRHGGQALQHEVTAFLNVRPSTVNGILDRMEERDLVRRSISQEDARQRLISLTDRGRERQDRFRAIHGEMEEVILRGFSPEEVRQFRTLLERAIGNLEEDRKRC